MAKTKFTKKITLKNAGLPAQKIEAIALEKKEEIAVCRIYGKVESKFKKGQTAFGPYTEFHGEFEAINLANGQKYRSKNLILPELGEMAVMGLISDATKDQKNDSVISVRFGLDITVLPHESSEKGWKFKFGVAPLVEPKGDDELTLLAKEFGNPPLLIATSEDAQKEKVTKKAK